MLTAEERERLFRELETMPSYLLDSFGGVAAEAQTRRGPGDTFSPVEQCWHLADLEAEGYAVRIRRLLAEEMPSLPDFDGDRVAQERQYRGGPGGPVRAWCREDVRQGLHAVMP